VDLAKIAVEIEDCKKEISRLHEIQETLHIARSQWTKMKNERENLKVLFLSTLSFHSYGVKWNSNRKD